jgi:hypothetical protein
LIRAQDKPALAAQQQAEVLVPQSVRVQALCLAAMIWLMLV